MADITIDNAVLSVMNFLVQPRSLVWIDKNTGYVFFINDGFDFHYRKTTDAGATWGTEGTIRTGTVMRAVVWYDRWTKDDTGTEIHIAFTDFDDSNITYNSLDTSDDSLSGEVTIFNGSSADSVINWSKHCISITKARGGNLYVGGWIDDDGERGFWRSTNSGVSWTSRSNVTDANAVDRIMFLAGNEADTNDIWCVYQDVGSNAITLKVYDNSGNSWSESAIIDGMSENNAFFGFDCMDRHSDGHAILVLREQHNSSAMDLAVHDITNIVTFSKKTDVNTNTFNYGICCLLINQQNDDLYVAYTTGTTVGAIKYKKSDDGGGTWGSESDMSVTSDDHRVIFGGTSVQDDGGRWMPIWYNDDLDDLVTNKDNSVELVVAVEAANIYNYNDAFVSVSYTG